MYRRPARKGAPQLRHGGLGTGVSAWGSGDAAFSLYPFPPNPRSPQFDMGNDGFNAKIHFPIC